MEPKVSTFIYCLGTTNIEGKNTSLNAMGILPVLTPEFIPSTFSFSIIIGIRGIDVHTDHKMDIYFMDSEGDNLVEATNIPVMQNQLQTGESSLPDEYRGILLGMDLRNVIIKREGTYYTRIVFDGKQLGEFDIYVKAKE